MSIESQFPIDTWRVWMIRINVDPLKGVYLPAIHTMPSKEGSLFIEEEDLVDGFEPINKLEENVP